MHGRDDHRHADAGQKPDAPRVEDVEALYVAGLAARLCPWALGEASLWIARSEAYRDRYRQLMPDGISPAAFQGRGAYGDYLAGQARVAGGY